MKNRRILVVYDRDVPSEPYGENLAELDCEIHFALDESNALKLVQELNPHLLILDAEFIEHDNFIFCERLNSNPPKFIRPATIAVTNRNELIDVEFALAAGIDDFLSKPFSPKELLKRIENLLLLSDLRRRF